jgi:hypothetical protein
MVIGAFVLYRKVIDIHTDAITSLVGAVVYAVVIVILGATYKFLAI